MTDDEIHAVFEQQAAGYDDRWAKTAPIRDALHLLMVAALSDLPVTARVLCVGVGTGDELCHLAKRFPQWTFAAVEPSGAMLSICRDKAERHGFADRCQFHEGYLDTLPQQAPFDAATCFLVSQFILAQDARIAFFRAIADRLALGGVLVSSDLASQQGSTDYEALLALWLKTMSASGITAAGREQMRAAYAKDVAILPPTQVAALICAAGFSEAVQFYQAGLIHAWLARRSQRTGR